MNARSRPTARRRRLFRIAAIPLFVELITVLITVPFAAPARADLFRRGDVDGSGSVNVSDAIVTLAYLFQGGEAPRCPDAMDADDGGTIAITDAMLTLAWVFLGGDAPPAPGPIACGVDPSADALADCAMASSSCAPAIDATPPGLPEGLSGRVEELLERASVREALVLAMNSTGDVVELAHGGRVVVTPWPGKSMSVELALSAYVSVVDAGALELELSLAGAVRADLEASRPFDIGTVDLARSRVRLRFETLDALVDGLRAVVTRVLLLPSSDSAAEHVSRFDALSEELERSLEELDAARESKRASERVLDAVRDAIPTLEEDLAATRQALDDELEFAGEFEDFVDSRCGGPVPNTLCGIWRDRLRESARTIARLRAEIAALETRLERARADEATALAALESARERIATLEAAVDEVRAAIDGLRDIAVAAGAVLDELDVAARGLAGRAVSWELRPAADAGLDELLAAFPGAAAALAEHRALIDTSSVSVELAAADVVARIDVAATRASALPVGGDVGSAASLASRLELALTLRGRDSRFELASSRLDVALDTSIATPGAAWTSVLELDVAPVELAGAVLAAVAPGGVAAPDVAALARALAGRRARLSERACRLGAGAIGAGAAYLGRAASLAGAASRTDAGDVREALVRADVVVCSLWSRDGLEERIAALEAAAARD